MVEGTSGALLKCTDEATQQFVQFLSKQRMIGGAEFVIQVLDERHLFVDKDKVEQVLLEIDKFSDSNAYNNSMQDDATAAKGKRRK